MDVAAPLLGFLAGNLSILSPCVLPLLPLILGASVPQHRAGPAALAGGVAISFVAIGLFVATIGFAIGLDGDFFRMIAGVLLVTDCAASSVSGCCSARCGCLVSDRRLALRP